MEMLHKHLLHAQEWDTERQDEFAAFVKELLPNWEAATNTNLTPKCHMLLHVSPFVKLHHYLAKYAEAQMESYHGKFRYTEQHNHANQGQNTAERLRRTLADKALAAVAPFLQK
jgi:hypothetical protein